MKKLYTIFLGGCPNFLCLEDVLEGLWIKGLWKMHWNLQGFSFWLNFSYLAKNVFKRAKEYVLLGFR
jgi:hypothetical protein